jgi:hypothetical protein
LPLHFDQRTPCFQPNVLRGAGQVLLQVR